MTPLQQAGFGLATFTNDRDQLGGNVGFEVGQYVPMEIKHVETATMGAEESGNAQSTSTASRPSPQLQKFSICGVIQEMDTPLWQIKKGPITDFDRPRINSMTLLVHCGTHGDLQHLACDETACDIIQLHKTIGLLKLS